LGKVDEGPKEEKEEGRTRIREGRERMGREGERRKGKGGKDKPLAYVPNLK